MGLEASGRDQLRDFQIYGDEGSFQENGEYNIHAIGESHAMQSFVALIMMFLASEKAGCRGK